MWPVSLVIAVSISSFTVWQVKSGYGWYRKEVDEVSGETIGACQGEDGINSDLYLLPNYAMQIATILAAGIMAWRTIGFDDDYSESKWVLALILVQLQVKNKIPGWSVHSYAFVTHQNSVISHQLQVLIVGGPLIALLQGVDPNLRTLGLALLTFTFPLCTMGLIIFPKVLAVRKMSRLDKDGDHDHFGASSSPPGEQLIAQEGVSGNEAAAEGQRFDITRTESEHPRAPRMQIVTFD